MKALLKGTSARLPYGLYDANAMFEYPAVYEYDEAHQQVLESVYENCADTPDWRFSKMRYNQEVYCYYYSAVGGTVRSAYSYYYYYDLFCHDIVGECMDPLPGGTWAQAAELYPAPEGVNGAYYSAEYLSSWDALFGWTPRTDGSRVYGQHATCACCRCTQHKVEEVSCDAPVFEGSSYYSSGLDLEPAAESCDGQYMWTDLGYATLVTHTLLASMEQRLGTPIRPGYCLHNESLPLAVSTAGSILTSIDYYVEFSANHSNYAAFVEGDVCTDHPKFLDRYGHSCETYEQFSPPASDEVSWCNQDFSVGGVHATTECCFCGGGVMNQEQVHEFMWSGYGVQYLHMKAAIEGFEDMPADLDASCQGEPGTTSRSYGYSCGTSAHPGGRLSLDAVSQVLQSTGARDLELLLVGSDSEENLGSYFHASAFAPMPLFYRYDAAHSAELTSLYDDCDVENSTFSNSLLDAGDYSCAHFAQQCMDPLPGKTWIRVKTYKDPSTGADYDYTQDQAADGTEVTCGCCRCKHLHGGGCTDSDGWVDSQGDGCSAYEASCAYSDEYADSDGVGANQACCVCGGGNQPVCEA
jgi:hypothetical protein